MALTGRSGIERGWRRLRGVLVCVLCAGSAAIGAQQPAAATLPARAAVPAEAGPAWRELSASQKDFLRPLERDWGTIAAQHKRKWLELTARVPKMSPDERERIQTRMTDWAKLTPEQRGQARLRYQEARQVPLRDRQARWDAYQSLPDERKRLLAERASEAARRPPPAREPVAPGAIQSMAGAGAPPQLAARPHPVAPTLVQARPGATTTSIIRPPEPPAHQQAGMPKIAATPDFVNKSTLLPRHGPQAASPRPASPASAPLASPARP